MPTPPPTTLPGGAVGMGVSGGGGGGADGQSWVSRRQLGSLSGPQAMSAAERRRCTPPLAGSGADGGANGAFAGRDRMTAAAAASSKPAVGGGSIALGPAASGKGGVMDTLSGARLHALGVGRARLQGRGF